MNSTSTVSITLGVEAIEGVDHFTYLSSVVETQGGTEADVKARIGKAMVAFLQLKNIWKSNVLSLKKRSGFSIQMSRLLFYAEQGHGRTTVTTTKRIQTFVKLSKKNPSCLVA